MAETMYRVWIEKHEAGWVTVTAQTEERARDRAQDVAMRDRWYPDKSHATPCAVEKVDG